jgi:arginase
VEPERGTALSCRAATALPARPKRSTSTAAVFLSPARDVTIRMIGVPLDFGASRRGVEMGPAALRIANMAESLELLGHSVTDVGDIPVPQRATISPELAGHGWMPLITRVCEQLALETAGAIAEGEVPLVLGGDHSLIAGSLAGAARHYAARGESVGCIYLDTHGDLHTPATSLTGNVHGMPLAHLLGHGDDRFRSIAGVIPALSPRGGSPASRCAISTSTDCAK